MNPWSVEWNESVWVRKGSLLDLVVHHSVHTSETAGSVGAGLKEGSVSSASVKGVERMDGEDRSVSKGKREKRTRHREGIEQRSKDLHESPLRLVRLSSTEKNTSGSAPLAKDGRLRAKREKTHRSRSTRWRFRHVYGGALTSLGRTGRKGRSDAHWVRAWRADPSDLRAEDLGERRQRGIPLEDGSSPFYRVGRRTQSRWSWVSSAVFRERRSPLIHSSRERRPTHRLAVMDSNTGVRSLGRSRALRSDPLSSTESRRGWRKDQKTTVKE